IWPSSPERDLAGYHVYRAESPDAAAADWIKLTAEPLANVTTFRDDRVVIGKRYYYKVTAVDRFDNESAASRIVSETANP
ncbi:MAG TPA: TolB protein, partial [Blastocatellia bacterium]|nr:TolB protein [Blastocatellia bacterium]